jgi:hypothetical protein
MATYQKYTPAIESMLESMNLGSDTWKVALATTINLADSTFTPGSTDLITGNGYTAGGNTCSVVSSTQSGGTYKLVLGNPAVWNATAAGFTFRYAVLWNATTNQPVGAWDYGSSQVVAAGETVTVTLDSTNGVLQAS